MSKALKQSANQYRNISGVHYQQWSSNQGEFDELKRECKALGLRFRVINGEFFREVKPKQ